MILVRLFSPNIQQQGEQWQLFDAFLIVHETFKYLSWYRDFFAD